MKLKILATLATGVAFGLGAASAQATTFAEYSATTSAANLEWTQSLSGTGGTLTSTGVGGSADTIFSYLMPGLSSLPALFTLTAAPATADDPAGTAFGDVFQQNLSGAFSFIYTGSTPFVVGAHTYDTGANLLSGTFSGAEIVGPNFGSTASVQDAVLSGGTVNYTSDVIAFASTGDKGVSLELTSALPFFGATPGNSLSSFTAVSTGSFSADINSIGGAGVPEPATWAAMLVGFGALGAVARRNRAKGVAAFA